MVDGKATNFRWHTVALSIAGLHATIDTAKGDNSRFKGQKATTDVHYACAK